MTAWIMKQRGVNLGAGGQKRKKNPNKQTIEVNANEQRTSLQLRLSFQAFKELKKIRLCFNDWHESKAE